MTSGGQLAIPGGHAVDVVRERGVGALVEFDPQRTESSVVEAVSNEAAAESRKPETARFLTDKANDFQR